MSNEEPRCRDGDSTLGSDLVERLVRLADSGPEIPADGADRLKDAIRPLWRAQIRARSRRRMLWVGGSIAAAASVVLTLTAVLRSRPPALTGPQPVATLAAVVGSVESLPPEGSTQRLAVADIGHSLTAGTWVRTGTAERAALELADGQSLRIDHDTRVRLSSPRVIELARGAIYVDSEDGGQQWLEVRTSFGVARDIGTQFEVRCDQETLTVKVREGAVAFSDKGAELEIRGGATVTIGADGWRQPGATSPSGSDWAWVLEVAPPFVIEGQTLVAFLDWVSRETGLWIRFAGSETEALAATTVLHGSIEGLDPAQATELVLAGCGLEAGRQDSTLVVGRRQPGPRGE